MVDGDWANLIPPTRAVGPGVSASKFAAARRRDIWEEPGRVALEATGDDIGLPSCAAILSSQDLGVLPPPLPPAEHRSAPAASLPGAALADLTSRGETTALRICASPPDAGGSGDDRGRPAKRRARGAWVLPVGGRTAGDTEATLERELRVRARGRTLVPEAPYWKCWGSEDAMRKGSLVFLAESAPSTGPVLGGERVTGIVGDRLGEALVTYFSRQCVDGCQSDRREKRLAALMHQDPRWGRLGGRKFPRAQRALRGGRCQTLGHSRAAFPHAVWCGLSWRLLLRRRLDMVLSVLVVVSTYARPSELLRLA